MAKGDDKRVRNKIDYEGGMSQHHLDNLRNDMVIPQAQMAQNNYTNAANRGFEDYGKLMGGYEEFQKTGGYSPLDLSNIRARSLSPIRALYSNANREVDRQKALQGGYSPGYGVLKARMAREMSSGLSDAAQNTEGMIAQLRNQGKQFGLSGASSLYGTSPGLAGHFGNMQNSTMNNWLQTQGMQNQLNLGLINAQQNASQIPGKWENTMGRLRDIGGIYGNVMTGGLSGGLSDWIRDRGTQYIPRSAF